MTERYIRELEAELRRARIAARLRRRILAETQDHLRADPGAVERFGSPAELAEQWRAEAGGPALGPAALLLGAVVAFVVPLYGIPENTLGPAPWAERPGHLTALLLAALGCFAVALGGAAAGVLIAWRRPRLARYPMLLAFGALVASAGCGLAAAALWPGAPALTYALTVPATALVLAAAGSALAWLASDEWPRPSRPSSTSQT